MKTGTRIACIAALGLLAAMNVPAAEEKAATLDQLLKQVQQGRLAESKENKAREDEFKRNQARQAQLLEQARGERAAQEARGAEMEKVFDENELRITEQTNLLIERLGSLKELFGVLQQASGDARGQFDNSLTNIQYPDRGKFLTQLAEKMGSTSQLASLEEIERLWFELQREMTESGKVVRFPATVITPEGDELQMEVIRVGVFNIVADGKYLSYTPETGKILELARQPAGRFVDSAEELTEATGGTVTLAVDPSRGQLLGLLIQEATFEERFHQGGIVGYITVALGAIGIVIALVRFIWLTMLSVQVAVQKRNLNKPSTLNPLGRVLQVYHANRNIDIESLELKLSEAVLKETPRLTRFNTLLKVIAVVAPLLGLLGTVVGMIITFQAITLFGTGDPKLMAGGISTALVTTVQGLCVAIPMVLVHTLVSGRSRHLIEILEEQATGLIAEASERQHRGAATN
ncbi:MAG: MotA/TolQ/ExbB proton channel family protein [Gammaproteobacteria bacterium]|nr:MotA/TolQ/ExbB proton channel family protein [Gammaproteobacteria bacterium]